MNAVTGSTPPSAPPRSSAPRHPRESSASPAVTFDLDPVPAESVFSSTPETTRSGVSYRVNTKPPIHVTSASNYSNPSQYDPSTFIQPTANLFDTAFYEQSSSMHLDPTGFVHPDPTDPYQFDAEAYLPDDFYGGDLNVPFPGIVPQLCFSPNLGRGDVPAALVEEPLMGEMQHPAWPSAVPRPTP
jgi:hypothetical protein